jgi:hypothetical protein
MPSLIGSSIIVSDPVRVYDLIVSVSIIAHKQAVEKQGADCKRKYY